jgi:hypothetical protein
MGARRRGAPEPGGAFGFPAVVVYGFTEREAGVEPVSAVDVVGPKALWRSDRDLVLLECPALSLDSTTDLDVVIDPHTWERDQG